MVDLATSQSSLLVTLQGQEITHGSSGSIHSLEFYCKRLKCSKKTPNLMNAFGCCVPLSKMSSLDNSSRSFSLNTSACLKKGDSVTPWTSFRCASDQFAHVLLMAMKSVLRRQWFSHLVAQNWLTMKIYSWLFLILPWRAFYARTRTAICCFLRTVPVPMLLFRVEMVYQCQLSPFHPLCTLPCTPLLTLSVQSVPSFSNCTRNMAAIVTYNSEPAQWSVCLGHYALVTSHLTAR